MPSRRFPLIALSCFATITSLSAAASADPVPPVSCSDVPFPGGSLACRDYAGDAWTPADAAADCSAISGATAPGSLAIGVSCDMTNIVGTCTSGVGTAQETRLHFFSGDAAMLASSCVNFLQGQWSTPLAGSCDHMMVFGPPGTPAMPACKEYDSAAWNTADAEVDCDTLSQSAFSPGTACATSPLGTCTVGSASLSFYMGDAATLETGCETPPPYGLGGQWNATQQGPALAPQVVDALTSSPTVTVSPDACLDGSCVGALLPSSGAMTFQPADGSATRGLILYPGGLVEPRAYAVAARTMAEQGFFVAVVPFPGNLPITDPMRGLATVMANPQIQHWAVAGHSLGGVAASIWAMANPAGKLEGIAFWASYPAPASPQGPAVDLSATSLKALTISASLDGVLNWTSYEDTLWQLPTATVQASIRGGNHAQFGYYGDQDGDQAAKISREHQHELFTGATVHLLNRLGLESDHDAIHPIYSNLGDVTEALCVSGQIHVAGMKNRDLRYAEVSNTVYPFEADFVLSKSEFPTDGSSLVGVTSHAHQGANPWDVTAPPIIDDEIWCKMKSQEAVAVEYGVQPRFEEGTCAQLNEWVFDWAFAHARPRTFLAYWFSGTSLGFADDLATASGPEWLASDVALISLGGSAFDVRAAALRTPLQGPPPPYNGNYYCRVWAPAAAAQFIVQRAATFQR